MPATVRLSRFDSGRRQPVGYGTCARPEDVTTMAFYSEAQRRLQDQFETRTLADTMEASIVGDELSATATAFIESRDFFFLSTVNAAGEPTVSYKGGDRGTVTVLDPSTLAFPAYDGNGMFLSMGNIDETAKIGMLFIDFETPNRVRVQATAQVLDDDPLKERFPGALLIVRATVDQAFVNCARYIHKHTRLESSPDVPDADGEQRYATWKRIDLLQDVLAPSDRGRAEAAGGTISADDYAAALEQGRS